GDADSVAGLLLEIIGQIPKANERASYNDYNFKIVSVNRRRIERIHIFLPQPTHEEG
ncbi:MAG: putative hemolysin, partial [Flavobacteriales bacterium]